MSNDVAGNAKTGEIQGMRPWEKFGHYLQQRAQTEKESVGIELTGNALDKILTATTEEEIWDADEMGLVALKDLVGAEVEFRSLKILPSSNEEMASVLEVYAISEICMLTEFRALQLNPGDVINVNTGVPTVLAKLRAFEAKGLWPVRAMIQGIPSANGTMVRLRPIPKRSVQGAAK